MKTRLCVMLIVFSFALVLAGEQIDKIQVEGNKKVSRDAIQFYMKSKEKGPYSEEKLREDFQALWDTGFFDDIRIDTQDSPAGKIVALTVKENPVIASVTYKTGKHIKESDITSKLQESNVSLAAASFFTPFKLKKVETVIMTYLQDKGFNDGKVTIEQKEVNGQVALTIHVDTGPKTRVGRVVFVGLDPRKVAKGFLTRGLKNNQPYSPISLLTGKNVYKKEKIDEDLEEVRLRLQQKGYLEAKVGTPELKMVNKLTIWGEVQRMLQISIPVEMGPRYKLGKLTIEGNKALRTEYIRSQFKLKTGKVYNIKKRNKAIEAINKAYGTGGYIYVQVIPTENLDPVKKVADLAVRIQENDVAYVGKLEFKGNTFTKDHVMRREWFLREGKRVNMNLLEDSIRRMKQLGLVTIDKMPDVKPDPADPTKINITSEVKELNRQQIQFNVGYGGYQGWFIGAGYSTQNFLGLGETFNLNVTQGTRQKEYTIGFTEPYLFNLPASAGFQIFKTYNDYPTLYTRSSVGFSLSTSWRFWTYWGGAIMFGGERFNINYANAGVIDTLNYLYYQQGTHDLRYISPTLQYTTVDSPVFPSYSGLWVSVNYRYSGGFLGGFVWMHKIMLEFVKFWPLWNHKHTLGFHLVYQRLKPFGGREVPYYERFYLGGEQSIRGFDIYRIGPKNELGQVIGGDKAWFSNVEYAIPVAQQFSFVFFYDVGNAFDVMKPINLRDVYQSMGLELKIYLPVLSVPFRLIFAYNPRLALSGESHWVFRFAVGPSFY